ncbi:MAG: hypothetical protein RI842_09945, partial [Schleiferiaceae bacterium]|nr:hypothetical protein [Schleiferiaceae bacterium]
MADLLLDDVEVVEKPACALSNMEAISQIGPYSATILSEPTGSLKQEIRFTTAGLGQYIINSTVNDTFQLTGLPPATRFKFYLRDSCANGQLSGWSGPWYFTTGCATLTAPWHEPFYNKELTCYQNYGTTFLNKWYVDYQVLSPYYSADFVKDHSNVGPATYFASPRVFNSLEDAFLELPEIDISSLTNPRLSFFLFSLNDDWYPDTFKNTLIRAQI